MSENFSGGIWPGWKFFGWELVGSKFAQDRDSSGEIYQGKIFDWYIHELRFLHSSHCYNIFPREVNSRKQAVFSAFLVSVKSHQFNPNKFRVEEWLTIDVNHNHGQNIWIKVKKSSKTGNQQKTVITASA